MKTITVKYDSKCLICQNWIKKGEVVDWIENIGIQHKECPTGIDDLPIDDSRLIVIEPDPDFYLK